MISYQLPVLGCSCVVLFSCGMDTFRSIMGPQELAQWLLEQFGADYKEDIEVLQRKCFFAFPPLFRGLPKFNLFILMKVLRSMGRYLLNLHMMMIF